MPAATFDTHQSVKNLQKAGLSPEAAEAITTVLKTSMDNMVRDRDLATKKDLLELEARLTRNIFNMLLGFGAIIVACIGIAAAFLK